MNVAEHAENMISLYKAESERLRQQLHAANGERAILMGQLAATRLHVTQLAADLQTRTKWAEKVTSWQR